MYMQNLSILFRDTRAQARRGQYDLTRMDRTVTLRPLPDLPRISFPSVIVPRDFPRPARAGSFDSPLVVASDPRLPLHLHHDSLRQYLQQYAQRRQPVPGLPAVGLLGAARSGRFFSG